MSKDAKQAGQGKLILGIDPALGTTGYGVIRESVGRLEVVDAGIVRCKRKESLENRLLELHEGITEIVQEHRPDCLAVEELYTHYERPTTAILMGHARGVILLAAAKAEIPVFSYAATQIKKTLTGNGRAPKNQMQFAVKHQLGLKELPEPADVADALAAAVTHCHLTLPNPLLTPHLAPNPALAELLKSQQ
ncbi:MAG: crossover junction endodeoxyribonuclease RuvC [Planctomycetota bacterium]